MNRREQRTYWNKERNKVVAWGKTYGRQIAALLRKEYNLFADAVEAEQGQRYANTFLIDSAMGAILQRIYTQVGAQYARQAYRDGLDEMKFFVPEDWAQAILDYLGSEFYNRGVLTITQTTRLAFLEILNAGIFEGLGAREIARRIRQDERIDLAIRARAEMIARTEIGTAIHTGQFVGAKASPLVKVKVWISAMDARTRRNPTDNPRKADHWELNGQEVALDAMFKDPSTGRELMHPHDKLNGKAVDVINCRCSFAVRNLRDADGNLIKKQ